MRILALSDEVVSTLYNETITSLVGDIDVLLACGDLPYSYLDYIITNLRVRDSFFVHGNHDSPEHHHNGEIIREPGGWQNVDRRAVFSRQNNLIVAGLEGSIQYKPYAPYQYTESEMRLRALQLLPKLLMNRIRHGRYMDIFIAHSPASGIHDGPDGAHRGFEVFLKLIHYFKPKLFIHGHKHHYGPGTWHTRYEQTEVINVHPFRIIELDENDNITYGKLYRR